MVVTKHYGYPVLKHARDGEPGYVFILFDRDGKTELGTFDTRAEAMHKARELKDLED